MIIFSTRLNQFKPIYRGGVELYRYADRLRALLADRLGLPYSELLAVPSISEDAKHFNDNAHWRSDYVANPKPLTQLPPADQQAAANLLRQYLATIHDLSEILLADSDARIRELGDFLSQAVQIPSLDCVRVENDRLVLVLWGFSSDESQKQHFLISKALEKYPLPAAQLQPENPPTPVSSTRLPVSKPVSSSPQATQLVENNEKTEKKRWSWWWLLLVLLVLGLGWLSFLWIPAPGQAFIPNNPDQVQPVDPGMTRPDPTDHLRRKLVMNRLLVLLEKDQTMSGFADELAKRYKAEQIKITHFNANVNLAQVTFADTNRIRWSSQLRNIPGVVTIVTDYIVSTKALVVPNDPQFANPAVAYHFKAVQAYQAWSLAMGQADVIVAVLDEGLDVNHPELTAHLTHPFDVVPDKTTINLLPRQTHGTHVAGLAIGAANNGQGCSGIAPGCSFMPIQISEPNIAGFTAINVIAGLSYAIKNGAKVINISLGMALPPEVATSIKALNPAQQKQLANENGFEEETLWREVFAYARRNHAVVVKAAGNEGILAELDPANRSSDIILVGATDQQNKRAEFSNFGSAITVSAPGVKVFSTLPGNLYGFMSGTSMAAPIVSGGVALLLSRNPALTFEQIKHILINTGQPVTSPSSLPSGPLIQLGAAVAWAITPPQPDCQVTIDSLKREIDRLKRAQTVPIQ